MSAGRAAASAAAVRRAWAVLLLAYAAVAALVVGAFAVDVLVAGVRPINERPPSFAPVDMLRTTMMVAAALIFVGGTVAAGRLAERAEG